ncbi:unnamed protein product, partial [Trichogramma brassicae]
RYFHAVLSLLYRRSTTFSYADKLSLFQSRPFETPSHDFRVHYLGVCTRLIKCLSHPLRARLQRGQSRPRHFAETVISLLPLAYIACIIYNESISPANDQTKRRRGLEKKLPRVRVRIGTQMESVQLRVLENVDSSPSATSRWIDCSYVVGEVAITRTSARNEDTQEEKSIARTSRTTRGIYNRCARSNELRHETNASSLTPASYRSSQGSRCGLRLYIFVKRLVDPPGEIEIHDDSKTKPRRYFERVVALPRIKYAANCPDYNTRRRARGCGSSPTFLRASTLIKSSNPCMSEEDAAAVAIGEFKYSLRKNIHVELQNKAETNRHRISRTDKRAILILLYLFLSSIIMSTARLEPRDTLPLLYSLLHCLSLQLFFRDVFPVDMYLSARVCDNERCYRKKRNRIRSDSSSNAKDLLLSTQRTSQYHNANEAKAALSPQMAFGFAMSQETFATARRTLSSATGTRKERGKTSPLYNPEPELQHCDSTRDCSEYRYSYIHTYTTLYGRTCIGERKSFRLSSRSCFNLCGVRCISRHISDPRCGPSVAIAIQKGPLLLAILQRSNIDTLAIFIAVIIHLDDLSRRDSLAFERKNEQRVTDNARLAQPDWNCIGAMVFSLCCYVARLRASRQLPAASDQIRNTDSSSLFSYSIATCVQVYRTIYKSNSRLTSSRSIYFHICSRGSVRIEQIDLSMIVRRALTRSAQQQQQQQQRLGWSEQRTITRTGSSKEAARIGGFTRDASIRAVDIFTATYAANCLRKNLIWKRVNKGSYVLVVLGVAAASALANVRHRKIERFFNDSLIGCRTVIKRKMDISIEILIDNQHQSNDDKDDGDDDDDDDSSETSYNIHMTKREAAIAMAEEIIKMAFRPTRQLFRRAVPRAAPNLTFLHVRRCISLIPRPREITFRSFDSYPPLHPRKLTDRRCSCRYN